MENRKIKFLRLSIFFIIFLFMFSLIGCDNEKNQNINGDIDQDKIDYLVQRIDELGSITLRKESDINNLIDEYNELNDHEKEVVTNSDILFDALKEIDYLKNECEFIIAGYNECYKYLDEIVPEKIEKEVTQLDLPKSYIYKTEYKEYFFKLDWSSNDLRTINSSGSIYHQASDVSITLKCSITCLVIEEKGEYTKEVSVKANPMFKNDGPKVIAYYYGRYNGFSDIDYQTIDIMNYCFAQIAKRQEGNKTIFYLDVSEAYGISKISEVHAHGMKACLSIGGWHNDATFWDTYSEASSTEENRKMVANSILEIMEEYQLDGIDMDWEYPKSEDRTNFTLLMKEINDTLKAKNPEYLVSIAVPCGSWTSSRYDYKEMNKFMDYFNIMSYDLDDGSSTTHLSDLKRAMNGVNSLIASGVDKNKIVVGAAFYGRVFNDVSSTNNGLGQSYSSKSTLSYTKIKSLYLDRLGNGVSQYYDSINKAYYLYDTENRCMISFDSKESVKDKYNYVVENELGGLMYWSHENDETGELIKSINEAKLSN